MTDTPITRADVESAGCWIDDRWGQYGAARLVSIASSLGWNDDTTELAARKLDECGIPGMNHGLTDDDEEHIMWASEAAEEWLNAHVAPGGYAFGWHSGEFFLMTHEWWEEEA